MTIIAGKRLLVPHDFSAASEVARRYALALAHVLGASVDVLHVTDGRPVRPAREIVRLARERESDLIVLGRHGRRFFAPAVAGSVGAQVVRAAPCPVITVPSSEQPFRISNVLVGIDFSPAAINALAYGRAFCRTFGATLHVLHVTENNFLRPPVCDPDMPAWRAEEQIEELLIGEDRASLPITVSVEVSERPGDALLSHVVRNAIDLVVVGTHGRPGLHRLLVGSVAEHVVRDSPCPVLTIHQPERDCLGPNATATSVARHPLATS
jgi:nucleotide-binding universal stress UspA family protein